MSNIMDWILSKLCLVDTDEEQEEPEEEQVLFEKSWLELVHKKKDKVPEDKRVFFKNIHSYDDCKLVIDNYKVGAVCIYNLEPAIHPEAQEMMNYICGGIYALGGNVRSIGENVFMVI